MAENTNLKFWEQLRTPPNDPTVLKKITGGRLSGKTDINPQWRLEKMTEVFGPVGVGWTYRIVRTWTEQGRLGPGIPAQEIPAEHEVVACAEIALKYRYKPTTGQGDAHGMCWSEEIPGIGGHQLVVRESTGFHTNDECYKMAVTDALSVAMKQLGMAADVYRGLFNDSKYSANTAPDNAGYRAKSDGGGKRFRN